MDGYDNLNDAVFYALHKTRETYGDKQEAISVVYEHGGKFHFTEPGSTARARTNAKNKMTIPKDAKVALIVHNHPEGRNNTLFSDEDIKNAERLKVPSAIIFGKTPTMRIYTPGKTRTDTFTGARSSAGDDFAGAMK